MPLDEAMLSEELTLDIVVMPGDRADQSLDEKSTGRGEPQGNAQADVGVRSRTSD